MGLCASCRNLPTCTYVGDCSWPILHCDEYEAGGSFRIGGLQTNPAESGAQVEGIPDEALGLCRDCAERDTCTFPRPEGGVWHCEEYR
jgi:hypothetical protein